MTDSPTESKNNQSPLKIRLSNSFNKIPVSLPKKNEQLKQNISTNTNFYNTIEYDSSILHKKLLKQGDDNLCKAQENRNNFKYRRGSQLTRKVEYQLNHTRYL